MAAERRGQIRFGLRAREARRFFVVGTVLLLFAKPLSEVTVLLLLLFTFCQASQRGNSAKYLYFLLFPHPLSAVTVLSTSYFFTFWKKTKVTVLSTWGRTPPYLFTPFLLTVFLN